MYCIYKHTSPSGKIYIGLTSQNPLKRWNGGYGYRNNQYFYRAIQKYGWENFKHEILFDGLTQEEAKKRERALIAYHDSTNPQNGYNISLGGGAHNPETIVKIRMNHKGTRGYHFSEEQKKNISKSKDGCKKAVICLELGEIYPSATAAARAHNLKQSNITACCKGRLYTTGGFHWGYI